MKNLSAFTCVTFLFCTSIFYSCLTDAPVLETTDIQGRWVVKEAFRGGKPTDLPVGMYFEFLNNGQAKTNFNVESLDQELTYEIKEGTIQMKGDSNLDIEAQKDLDGNLTFNTSLANYKFKLVLEYTPEEG